LTSHDFESPCEKSTDPVHGPTMGAGPSTQSVHLLRLEIRSEHSVNLAPDLAWRLGLVLCRKLIRLRAHVVTLTGRALWSLFGKINWIPRHRLVMGIGVPIGD